MRLSFDKVARASVLLTVIANGCAGKAEHSSDGGGAGNGGTASAGAPASGARADAGSPSTSPPSSRCHGGCAVEGPRPVPTARPDCPQAEPVDGAACDLPTHTCSYGDSAAVACRRSYDCLMSGVGATWVLNTALQASYPCSTLPPGYCPATPPPELTPCTVAAYNIPCTYGVLVCYCGGFGVPMAAGSPGKWGCAGPPADLACPALLPNIGEGCAAEGTECDYANGCLDPRTGNVFCHEGAWEQGMPYECLGK